MTDVVSNNSLNIIYLLGDSISRELWEVIEKAFDAPIPICGKP